MAVSGRRKQIGKCKRPDSTQIERSSGQVASRFRTAGGAKRGRAVADTRQRTGVAIDSGFGFTRRGISIRAIPPEC